MVEKKIKPGSWQKNTGTNKNPWEQLSQGFRFINPFYNKEGISHSASAPP